MDDRTRWGRDSPIHMATADNGPSQMAIGSRPSLNNFANANDYNYDGLVVNKSQAGQYEFVRQKWPLQDSTAEMVSFKGPREVQVFNKKVNKKEVLPDEDKMMEHPSSPLARENYPNVWHQPLRCNNQPLQVQEQRLVELKQAEYIHFSTEKQLPVIDLKQPPIIDKRQLKKKEVLPSDAKDAVYQKQPQKRCADDQTKEDIFEGLETISLRETDKEQVHELIESINLKKQLEPKCMNFDPQKFSAPENLVVPEINAKSTGSFGEVIKVFDLKTRINLIRKKIKDKVDLNEIKVPIQFSHRPNLCAMYGFYFDGSTAFIVQEDAGASIRQLGSDAQFRQVLARPEVTERIVFGIFQGLAVLDSHNIVHCDIKPENVCLKQNADHSYTPKLIDFGSCKTQKDKMTYSGLTPEYLPPNINEFLYNVMQKKVTAETVFPRLTGKDDVWGAGMVTLYMKKGEHPIIKHFLGHPDYPRDQNVMACRCKVMRKTAELTNPLPGYFTTGKDVLDEMLHHVLVVDSGARWSSSEVVSFFKAKLNPEPQMKRHKQEAVLCQPRFVQNDYKLIKRDNSTEDVDLKASKGVYQPHMPASPNAPVEDTLGDTFGAAFRLKQDGQNPNTAQSEAKAQHNLFFQSKVEQSGFQNATLTQNQPSAYFPQRVTPLEQHSSRSQQQFRQMPCSRKVVLPAAVQGLWGDGEPMDQDVAPMDQDEAEYDELVQFFLPRAVHPQNEIGNIPNMGALLDDGYEDGRIKIKGRRRSKRE